MANTVINGKIFGDLVKSYIEGSGVLLGVSKVTPYVAETGDSVEVPIAGFLGEAIEVVNGKATYVDVTDKSKTIKFKQYDKGVKLEDALLKASIVDRSAGIRAQQTSDSIVAKLESLLLAEVDTNAPKLEVKAINDEAVLDAQGLLGQRLNQRETYIVGNGKTISKLQDSVKADKTDLNSKIFSSIFVILDAVADDTFYLIQKDALEVFVGRDLQSNVYREGDFHGVKIISDIIAGVGLIEEDRAVKVTVGAGK